MPRVLVYFAVVSVLTYAAHAQWDAEDVQSSGKLEKNFSSSGNEVYEGLFRKTFSLQRKEHMEAIKRLQRVDNYERLYKMIMIVGEKMIDVIRTSKALLDDANFNPDHKLLPRNVTIQSAISTTLENTALFGDILLHFPHIVHRVLKKQEKWRPTIDWSFDFAGRANYLLDAETVHRIRLASQEFDTPGREPGYFNPYWQPDEARKDETVAKKKSEKKRKQKRGPQMTKIEL